VDSTFVKNIYGRHCTSRNPTDRGRKAVKISVLVDNRAIILGILPTPANIPDVVLLRDTLQSSLIPLDHNTPLLADKGYDSRKNRKICHDFKLLDRISRKKQKTGRRMNAKRSIVERCFSWLDKYRRLIMMYEQNIETHISFILFVMGNIQLNRSTIRNLN